MNLPEIKNYGQYSGDNYGVNSLKINSDNWTIWYSYRTIVAFFDTTEFCIIQNYWSTTTGKHLNFINLDKTLRLDKDTFQTKLKSFLIRNGLNNG